MRVLITGSTGLLGSRMTRVFPPDWDVAVTDTQPRAGCVQLRLEDRHSVLDAIHSGPYDWVVHCAAISSPSVCHEDPRRAVEINSQATGWVARATADMGAKLAYASSHHVFAGDHPPYREDDAPAPLNVYGHSKLAGERHALSVPGALVVRLPALYCLDPAAPNSKLNVLRDRLRAGQTIEADATNLCYYTLADEVATAFAFLMANGCRGTVHVSAPFGCTELDFYRVAAERLGLDGSLVVERAGEPAVRRPRDSRLDTTLYQSLGGAPLTPCHEVLAALAKV